MSGRGLDIEARARLARAVSRVCPASMVDERDDFVQMSAMKILRSSSVPDELSNAFLHRVAYSVVVDEIRRRRRRNEVAMSPSMPDRIANSAELSPETRTRGAEVGRVLVEVVGTLNDDRRRAVTLYLQGHGVPEVARVLGWPRKRASNAVYRGLEQVRDRLRERGIRP